MLTRERRDELIVASNEISKRDESADVSMLAAIVAQILRSLPISEETSE